MADANTEWVDARVKAIKPPRSGISNAAVNRVRNPFIYVYKTDSSKGTKEGVKAAPAAKKTVKKTLQLVAVMNNSALINGNWYRTNDKIQGYTVANIKPDSVLLKKGKAKRTLFVTQENQNIKIQVK